MRIIGIHGPIGHGKSTLAEAFMQATPTGIHLESFHVIADVAEAWLITLRTVPRANDIAAINIWLGQLPAILQATLQLTETIQPILVTTERATSPDFQKLFLQLQTLREQPELLKQPINESNKPAYRPLLQWLGGYVTNHIDRYAWYRELVRQAQATANVTVAVISGLRLPSDGEVIQQNDGLIIEVNRPDVPLPDQDDPTERDRQLIKTDIRLFNDGDLRQLTVCAATILKDIEAGEFKGEYHARSM